MNTHGGGAHDVDLPPERIRDLPGHAVPTSLGPARVRVAPGRPDPDGATHGTLLLGHGAGGSRDAADVLALTTLHTQGWTIVLVDQPWRVAGRRVATPPPTLDRAWSEVVASLGTRDAAPDGTLLPRPWVYGGRSAGARVACRTSVTAAGTPVEGVAGVLCLAFPLHLPGHPERSRRAELAAPPAAGLPTLVVNGTRDPMGSPEEIRTALGDGPLPLVQEVPGTHAPSLDLDAVVRYAADFLDTLLEEGPRDRPRGASDVADPR